MKIFIAVPTYENISPDTFKSIYGLDRGNHWCVFDFVRGYDCAAARNNIARQTLNENADFVLMVDSDVILPSDALVNLMEDPKDVCIGFYAHRPVHNLYDGRVNVCKLGEFNYTDMYRAEELEEEKCNGKKKIPVHGGGLGCALIRAEVFRRIHYPWFSWVNYENGEVLSEDLYFCEMCKNAGISVYADVRVGCGHIMRRTQWPV